MKKNEQGICFVNLHGFQGQWSQGMWPVSHQTRQAELRLQRATSDCKALLCNVGIDLFVELQRQMFK